MSESKKYLLTEKDIPTAWYNIIPSMPTAPRPMLHPATKLPLTPEDLYPLFSEEAASGAQCDRLVDRDSRGGERYV